MFLFAAYVLIGILFWRLREINGRVSEWSIYLGREGERSRANTQELAILHRDLEIQRGVAYVAEPPAVPVPEAPAPWNPPPPPEPSPVPPPLPEALDEISEEVTVPETVPDSPETVEEIVVPRASDFVGQMAESEGGWEQFIGGNLLNKLGAFVLVIGIALFLSYSFANMGPAGRAFTALGLSGTILAGGTLLEKKDRYRVFSRGIIATGWAGLYFTSFAMHSLPAARVIESPVLGTMLMCATAAGMIAHALRYRVQSLVALTFACLFGALALSEVNIFVAIALVPIAVGMLYLARRFEWHGISLLAAAGAYAVFLTRPASDAPLATIQAMLVLYWVLFEAFDILRIQSRAASHPAHHLLFGINAAAGLTSSAVLWYRLAPDSMWIFCAGAAALYLASMWIRFALDGETHYETSLAISAVMSGLAVFARVPGLWVSVGLMLEAEVLFLAAWALRIRFAKILSWIGFVVALMHIADRMGVVQQVTVLGWFSVYNTTPPLVIFAGLLYLNRYLSKDESYWSYPASALIAVAAAFETNLRFIGFVWIAWSTLLFEFGLRKRLAEFRIQAYVAAMCGTAVAVVAAFDTHPPAWTFAIAAVVFYAQAVRANREMPALWAWERTSLRFGATSCTTLLAGLFVHLAVPRPYEGVALMALSVAFVELGLRGWPSEVLRPAALMNAAALLRVWITHMGGLQKHPETAVAISFGGAALAYYWFTARFLRSTNPDSALVRTISCLFASGTALLALWMLVPAPFVPIAFAALAALTVEAGVASKATDLVLLGRILSGISMVALTFDVPAGLSQRVGNAAAVAAFQLLTSFRVRRDVAPAAHSIAAAFIIAVTLFNEVSGGMLTLSWGLEGIALLAFGFVLRDRWLRLPGLGLLILCIGKVFFYDLRNLETMYRILSFIGLGAILLAVSWIYTRFKEQMQRLL